MNSDLFWLFFQFLVFLTRSKTCFFVDIYFPSSSYLILTPTLQLLLMLNRSFKNQDDATISKKQALSLNFFIRGNSSYLHFKRSKVSINVHLTSHDFLQNLIFFLFRVGKFSKKKFVNIFYRYFSTLSILPIFVHFSNRALQSLIFCKVYHFVTYIAWDCLITFFIDPIF